MNKNQIKEIRKDFPYITSEKTEENIIYFDNAATTQRPIQVIDSLTNYYSFENANPHRGAHKLSIKSTEIYESARKKVKEFLNAKSSDEIIFTKNTTESLNLISYSYGLNKLKAGDEILISIMEHHSNLVIWQDVAKKTGAKLKYLYLNDNYDIELDEFKKKLTDKTKIFSITGGSNCLATMPNIKEMIKLAKEKGSITIVDGAQLSPHKKVDVLDLNCDFYAFSGHKLFSPMGIGVLYGKKEILNQMEPFLFGGNMIEYVYEQESKFSSTPARFESGTPNVAGAMALAKSIDYLEKIGFEEIFKYESSLMDYAYQKIKEYPYIKTYTTESKERCPVLMFNFDDIHPHDVASILDSFNIAIRSGHHCAQPLHRHYNLNSSCRASFAFYNTFEEIDYFIEKLVEVRKVMGFGH